jgi:hypothetical protein
MGLDQQPASLCRAPAGPGRAEAFFEQRLHRVDSVRLASDRAGGVHCGAGRARPPRTPSRGSAAALLATLPRESRESGGASWRDRRLRGHRGRPPARQADSPAPGSRCARAHGVTTPRACSPRSPRSALFGEPCCSRVLGRLLGASPPCPAGSSPHPQPATIRSHRSPKPVTASAPDRPDSPRPKSDRSPKPVLDLVEVAHADAAPPRAGEPTRTVRRRAHEKGPSVVGR